MVNNIGTWLLLSLLYSVMNDYCQISSPPLLLLQLELILKGAVPVLAHLTHDVQAADEIAVYI